MKNYRVLLNNSQYGHVSLVADAYTTFHDEHGNVEATFTRNDECVAWFSGVIGIVSTGEPVIIKSAPR